MTFQLIVYRDPLMAPASSPGRPESLSQRSPRLLPEPEYLTDVGGHLICERCGAHPPEWGAVPQLPAEEQLNPGAEWAALPLDSAGTVRVLGETVDVHGAGPFSWSPGRTG